MTDHVTEQFLLPARPLQAFLDHVELRGAGASRSDLMAIWRQARTAFAQLAEREAGCADDAAILPVPPAMAPHVEAVTVDPAVNRAFDRVPVVFGLIELDATMCAEPTLVTETLTAMRARWNGELADPALAEACLPLAPRAAADTRAHFDGRTLSIASDAADLRWLASRLRGAAEGVGPDDAELTLAVGRMPALMHAVRLNGRLLLVEGQHRARVLRALGETYLPCLISSCVDLDEVREAAPSLADVDLDRYFDADRPPMLRDHDRDALVHRYPARTMRRLLQLRIDVEHRWVP